MAVIGLDHIQLAMPRGGEDDARAFYCGLLGMQERAKPEPLASRGGCWFEAGGLHIHLGTEEPFRAAKKAHPALLVYDLALVRKTLVQQGVAFVGGTPLDGYVHGDVNDPFGNRIALMQRI